MERVELERVEDVLCRVSQWSKLAGEGVSVAKFSGFGSDGHFLVTLSDGMEPVRAISTVRLAEPDVGVRIVVAFEKANVRLPIIVGRVEERSSPEPAVPAIFKLDGERIVLKAERDIELRCGDASIILTRAGKVLIRGAYVLSRSRGANKIKGAHIELN